MRLRKTRRKTARRPKARLLRVCAWCDHVWLGRWVPLERALARLGVDRLADAGPLTHGICECCLDAQLEKVAAAKLAA